MATFDYQSAAAAGYSPQEIQAYLQSHPDVSPGNGQGNILSGPTLPLVGGGLGGLVGSILGPVGTVAGAGIGYAGLDAVRRGLMDLNNQTAPGVNTIMNPGSGQVSGNDLYSQISSGPRNAAITAALVRGGPSIWKYMTTGGIGNVLQQKYQQAAEAGNAADVNPAIESAKQVALQKVGQGGTFDEFSNWLQKNIPGSSIASQGPAPIEGGSPQIADPNEVWGLAKQMGTYAQERNPLGQAFQAARGPVADLAHSMTPGVGLPNFLSHLYMSSHVDPAKLLGGLGVGGWLLSKARGLVSPPSGN